MSEEKENNQHAIIKAAEDLLNQDDSFSPLNTNKEVLVVESHPTFSEDYNPLGSLPDLIQDPTPPQLNQKFGDIPTQLREKTEVNFFDIKKLNLASIIEALERANQSYEAFPTPDAGFAVASLSEQVQKLTKDLEKSQDPKKLYDSILINVLQPFAELVVHSVALEMKALKENTKTMIIPEKSSAYSDSVNTAAKRIGPSLKDGMELSKVRLLKSLGIKEKPPV